MVDGGEPDATDVAPTTTARRTEPTAPEATLKDPPSPAELIVKRLKAKGFNADENEVQDVTRWRPIAEFEVMLGAGKVTGYVYSSDASAAKKLKEFAPVERDFPDQFEARRVGRVLYVGTIEEPGKLPMPEYRRVVQTGGDAE